MIVNNKYAVQIAGKVQFYQNRIYFYLFHSPFIFRLDDCGNCEHCINKIVYGMTENNRCILKSKCLAQSNDDQITCDGEYEMSSRFKEARGRDKDKKEDDHAHHIVCSDSAGTLYMIES